MNYATFLSGSKSVLHENLPKKVRSLGIVIIRFYYTSNTASFISLLPLVWRNSNDNSLALAVSSK
jgi:hypothetical protein